LGLPSLRVEAARGAARKNPNPNPVCRAQALGCPKKMSAVAILDYGGADALYERMRGHAAHGRIAWLVRHGGAAGLPNGMPGAPGSMVRAGRMGAPRRFAEPCAVSAAGKACLRRRRRRPARSLSTSHAIAHVRTFIEWL